MTDKKIFHSKGEELEKLTREISDIKGVIKEVSSAVARIERHVKRSFGIAQRPKGEAPETSKKGSRGKPRKGPSITSKQALKLFDDLSGNWDCENYQAVKLQLQKMDTPNLRLIANELGVPLAAKLSKKSLCSSIVGRLNERALLSKNVNAAPS